MRVVLYSPQGGMLSEALALQQRAQAAGIEATEYAMGQQWEAVLNRLEPGDELVVSSLDCFASLNELLGFVASRGGCVRSLDEPWFSDPIDNPLDYQRRLYELSSSLHAARTRRGLCKAALDGRKPGRILGSVQNPKVGQEAELLRVDVLRRMQKLPVSEACRQAGISVWTYYRKRKQQNSNNF